MPSGGMARSDDLIQQTGGLVVPRPPTRGSANGAAEEDTRSADFLAIEVRGRGLSGRRACYPLPATGCRMGSYAARRRPGADDAPWLLVMTMASGAGAGETSAAETASAGENSDVYCREPLMRVAVAVRTAPSGTGG